jgi:hypothetical protein
LSITKINRTSKGISAINTLSVYQIELEDSNTDREKEVVVNEIQTLKCVLGHLFNLKYDEKVRATEIVEANNNWWQENRLIKIQDAEC